MTLGNIIDFIHANCYPVDGYIQVMKGQKIVVVFDPDHNEIEIINECPNTDNGVWTASLKFHLGTIATSVDEIGDALSDLELARETLAKIVAHLESIDDELDVDKGYIPWDINGPYASISGNPIVRPRSAHAKIEIKPIHDSPRFFDELKAWGGQTKSPPHRQNPYHHSASPKNTDRGPNISSDHSDEEERDFSPDIPTNPHKNPSRYNLDE